jgi:hypothetical protein
MKGETMPSMVQLKEETLQQLTTEVKETIALSKDAAESSNKNFGVVDLWNRQRKMRSASSSLSTRRWNLS